MAISFNDNIRISAPKPIDAKYLNSSNQPYASVGAVNSAILVSERYVGLTVNINNVEYWYETGTANGNLVEKTLTVTGDGVVSGATYGGSILTLKRTESLPDVTVSIGVSGVTDGVVSGATLSGATLHLKRTIALPDVTVDLSSLSGTTTDIYVSGGTLSGATLLLNRTEGQSDVSIDLSALSGGTTIKQVFITTVSDVAIPNTSTNTIYVASGTTGYTLSIAPTTGSEVTVVDELGTAGTNNIYIDGNGKTIYDDTYALINTNNGSLTLTYNGFKWNVTSFVS